MIAVVIIFIVTYLLIASEKIDKTVVALLGASAVIFTAENKEHFYKELGLSYPIDSLKARPVSHPKEARCLKGFITCYKNILRMLLAS